MMKARFYCFLVLFLYILSLVGVLSRQFPTNDGYAASNNNQGAIQNHQSLKLNHTSNELKSTNIKKIGLEEDKNATKYKEVKKIGSMPPSCEHKCYGCMPCEAIQVPTTSRIVGVQYTNYEPEGWKCKCGLTFYSP